MGFRSVKLFALFTFTFFVFGFLALLLSGRVLHSLEIPHLFSSFPLALKVSVVALFTSLLLISLQTLYCALPNRLISLLFHSSLALSIFLVLLFPLTSKTVAFYLYPGSFVEVGGKKVALTEVVPEGEGFALKVFVEEGGKRAEGEVSFNSPFSSPFGTLWFSGVRRGFGLPLFEFKLLKPTPLPSLLLITGSLTVIFGLIYTLSSLRREGRDVRKRGREGAPEANRRAP